MKVLMVCLGNICRSPMAEGMLRHLAHLDDLEIEVDSAGTAAYHTGEPPDARMQYIARSHGVNISNQKARQFKVEDFDYFDHILVMDHQNYGNVIRFARNEEDEKKVDFILNYLNPNSDDEVPDPYYGGDAGFENVYNLLRMSCEVIIKQYKG